MPNDYSAAFDELASRYDQEFTNRPASRILRQAVWKELEKVFRPGQLVLDIGCGTGEDALFLAQQGVHVTATDVSAKMIERAMEKSKGYEELITFTRGDAAELISDLPGWLEMPGQLAAPGRGGHHHITIAESSAAPLDGLISNFGVLNCLSRLGSIRSLADQYLRPDGYLFFCLINRFYLREVARGGFRRFRANGVPVRCGTRMVSLYYHSLRQLRWPGYDRVKLIALAVFSHSDVHRHWPFNRWGDHYLLVLRKQSA